MNLNQVCIYLYTSSVLVTLTGLGHIIFQIPNSKGIQCTHFLRLVPAKMDNYQRIATNKFWLFSVSIWELLPYNDFCADSEKHWFWTFSWAVTLHEVIQNLVCWEIIPQFCTYCTNISMFISNKIPIYAHDKHMNFIFSILFQIVFVKIVTDIIKHPILVYTWLLVYYIVSFSILMYFSGEIRKVRLLKSRIQDQMADTCPVGGTDPKLPSVTVKSGCSEIKMADSSMTFAKKQTRRGVRRVHLGLLKGRGDHYGTSNNIPMVKKYGEFQLQSKRHKQAKQPTKYFCRNP